MDCCSVDSAPPERTQLTPGAASSRSSWQRTSAVLTAVGVALLPKCPACWSIYAGLSSALGVSFVVEPALLLSLTLASLALAVAALASAARRTGRHLSLVVGIASALVVWAGKFQLYSDTVTWLGLLGLLAASLATRQRAPLALASELPEHAQAR